MILDTTIGSKARARLLAVAASLFTASALLISPIRAAEELDADFLESYVPYQQYSPAAMRDLSILQETDLLESSLGTDGVVLRVLGKNSAFSKLVSARIAIDSVAMRRMVVKIVPYDPAPDVRRRPEVHRAQITAEQAQNLMSLLERWSFWDAPYTIGSRGDRSEVICADGGEWLIEGVTSHSYQIIFRSSCGGLDPAAAEIRDFLLGIVGISAAGSE